MTRSYPLERENSRLWREYYNARLAHLKVRLADAEKAYQAIGEDERAESKLRAYALCDWGELLVKRERLGQQQGWEKARTILERIQRLDLQMDSKLMATFLHLKVLHAHKCEWNKGLACYQRNIRSGLKREVTSMVPFVTSELLGSPRSCGRVERSSQHTGAASSPSCLYPLKVPSSETSILAPAIWLLFGLEDTCRARKRPKNVSPMQNT